MNADEPVDLHGGKRDFPNKEETYRIVGFAFDIINELGHGLNEKIYENSLVVAFRQNVVPYEQQRRFEVLYSGERVGEFIPDLIAFDQLVIDTKVIDRITDHERGQVLNYLKITKLQVALILNFKHAKLEWERVVLTAGDKKG